MIEKIQLDGSTLMDITTREWHQCPQLVRNYLANVTYDPSDYSTSQVAGYAPSPAVAGNDKPIGKTVNGVTYYSEVPNVAKPIVSGSVKPLDFLRWINTPVVSNVRDLGGWSCDAGTVKYGKIIRGAELNTVATAADKSIFINDLGIQVEVDFTANEGTSGIDDSVEYLNVSTDSMYSSLLNLTTTDYLKLKLAIEKVFDSVKHRKPIYFHCTYGADRTGTMAVLLEALLGVSQSDVDKDYELTTFSKAWDNNPTRRARNGGYLGLDAQYAPMMAFLKTCSTSSNIRDCAVAWCVLAGINIADINRFRQDMINVAPGQTIPIVTPQINYNAADVSLSETSGTIDVGATRTVTATRTPSWATSAITASSSNTSFATVSVSGNVVSIVGVASGSAIITVSCNGHTATYTATIQSVEPSYTNLFIPASAELNKRFSSTGTISGSALNGSVVVGNYIDVSTIDKSKTTYMYIKGATLINTFEKGSPYYNYIVTYNSSKAVLSASSYHSASGINFEWETLGTNYGRFKISKATNWANAVYIRLNCFVNATQTAIAASDIANMVVTIDEPIV